MRFFAALLLGFATAASASGPAADNDDSNVVVVHVEHRRVIVSRFNPEGTQLDDHVVSSPARPQSAPAIAFDGTNHLIVWIEEGDVLGRFFTPDGDFDGGLLRFTAGARTGDVTVAWLGKEYLVAWSGAHASAAAVTPHGSMTALQIFAPPEQVDGDVAVAANEKCAVIAYGNGAGSIRTLRLSGHSITARSLVEVTRGIAIHHPRIAQAPWGFLIGWSEEGESAWLHRLDGAGSPVGRPLPVVRKSGKAGATPYFVEGTARVIVEDAKFVDDVLVSEENFAGEPLQRVRVTTVPKGFIKGLPPLTQVAILQ